MAHPVVAAAHAEPRKRPSQARSIAAVAAMVEAAARIVEARGWAALTTNHVAERAGFSIGCGDDGMGHECE